MLLDAPFSDLAFLEELLFLLQQLGFGLVRPLKHCLPVCEELDEGLTLDLFVSEVLGEHGVQSSGLSVHEVLPF